VFIRNLPANATEDEVCAVRCHIIPVQDCHAHHLEIPPQICRHFSNLYALNKPDWSFSGYFCGYISRKRSRLPHTHFHRFIRHDASLQGSKYPLPVRKVFRYIVSKRQIKCCLSGEHSIPFHGSGSEHSCEWLPDIALLCVSWSCASGA
jgi:hypothetical protein